MRRLADVRTVGIDGLRTWKSAAQGIPTYSDGGESLRKSGDAEGIEHNPEEAGGYSTGVRDGTRIEIPDTLKINEYLRKKLWKIGGN